MLSARCDRMDPQDPVLLAFLKTGCNRHAFLQRINHLLLDTNETSPGGVGQRTNLSPLRHTKSPEVALVVQDASPVRHTKSPEVAFLVQDVSPLPQTNNPKPDFVVQALPFLQAPAKRADVVQTNSVPPSTFVQTNSVPPSSLRLETGSASQTNKHEEQVKIDVELSGQTYTSYSAVRTTSYNPRLLTSTPNELASPPSYKSLARSPNLMEITPAACSGWPQV